MKCKLCGAEWVERNGHFHPDNACPLSGVCTYRALIVAINEAIKAAKKGTRKPEECGYMENDGDRKICGLHMMYVDTKRICPCASWTKA